MFSKGAVQTIYKLWWIISFAFITFISLEILITNGNIPPILMLAWLFNFSFALYSVLNNGKLIIHKPIDSSTHAAADSLTRLHAKISELRFFILLISFIFVCLNLLNELALILAFVAISIDSYLLIYRKTRKGLIT